MTSNPWGNEFLNLFSGRSGQSLQGAEILIAVGSLDVSGGTNIILWHAEGLRRSGANVTLGFMIGEADDADWHVLGSRFSRIPLEQASRKRWDLVIATWWPTVYEVAGIQATRYLYFVQSLESRFARNSSDYLAEALACHTYLAEIPIVTVSSWLLGFLSSISNSSIYLVRNGINKQMWSPVGPKRVEKSERNFRALVEGPLGVPMKAVEESVDVCISAGVDEIWHVSPSPERVSTRVTRAFSRVPMDSMASIYRSVDVLVKLSRVEGMFGPPLEAFHCGATAVVSQVTGWDEYVEDGTNAISVCVDDFDAAKFALESLKSDPHLLSELKRGALHTAQSWPSTEQSSAEFASICSGLLRRSGSQGSKLGELRTIRETVVQLSKRGVDPREGLPPLFHF